MQTREPGLLVRILAPSFAAGPRQTTLCLSLLSGKTAVTVPNLCALKDAQSLERSQLTGSITHLSNKQPPGFKAGFLVCVQEHRWHLLHEATAMGTEVTNCIVNGL